MLMYFFFFNDTATTEIYTLSLHDALPIYCAPTACSSTSGPPPRTSFRYEMGRRWRVAGPMWSGCGKARDRKSTRLNSSHLVISYAVFCLKKKKQKQRQPRTPRQSTHPLGA